MPGLLAFVVVVPFVPGVRKVAGCILVVAWEVASCAFVGPVMPSWPFVAPIVRIVVVCSRRGLRVDRWLLGRTHCWPFGGWRDLH